MQDYYALLGVPDFCDSAQELRKAYKEQVLFFHPDKGNVNENIALERTQLLNEAYKTLKDPEKKARYDEELNAYLQRGSYAAQKRQEEKAREEQKRREEERQRAEAAARPAAKRPAEKEPQPAQAASHTEKTGPAEIFARAWHMLPPRVAVLVVVFAFFFAVSLINLLAQSLFSIGGNQEIDSGVFAVNEYQHKLLNSTIVFNRQHDRIHETVAFLESQDAGYGSPQFFTDQKLIVMRRDDPPRPLELSIRYPGSLSIYTNQDTDAAEVVFEDNVWYDSSTTLRVKANHAGTTVITFSNNRNFDSFLVKIIVL